MGKTTKGYKVRKCNNVEAVYSDIFDRSSLTAVLKFDANIIESRYQAPVFRFLTQYLLEQEWNKIKKTSSGFKMGSNINCNGVLSIRIDVEDEPAMGQARLEKAIKLALGAIDSIKRRWLKEFGTAELVDLRDLPSLNTFYCTDMILFDAVKEVMWPDNKTPEVVCSYHNLIEKGVHRGAYHKFLVRLFSRQNVRTTIYANSDRPSIQLGRIVDMLSGKLSSYQRPKMVNWSKREIMSGEASIDVLSPHPTYLGSIVLLGCELPFNDKLWATIMVMHRLIEEEEGLNLSYFNNALCVYAESEVYTKLQEFVMGDYAEFLTDEQIGSFAKLVSPSGAGNLSLMLAAGEMVDIAVDHGVNSGYNTGSEIDMIEKLSEVTKEDVESVFKALADGSVIIRASDCVA
ncbi:MAG: hypothetical protein Q4C83_02855 [Candidatus Saccharibacteria bacterium]|nr:hypothetical protein [Candidatus Saccharibacteria bacterium]